MFDILIKNCILKALYRYCTYVSLLSGEHFLTTTPRELQAIIESTSLPASPFHLSHAAESTDTHVYAPPSAGVTDEPESKKRKLAEGVVNGDANHGVTTNNDLSGARYYNQMVANKHITNVHSIVKKQCEELADAIVGLPAFGHANGLQQGLKCRYRTK